MTNRFAYIFVSILLIACQREVVPYSFESGDESLVDKVFSTSAQTRTSLSGSSIIWDSADKVSVFDGAGNRRFAVTVDGNVASIHGRAVEISSYCLLYPYNEYAGYCLRR